MNAVVRALKATYNFFAGDIVILMCVAAAFVLAAVLVGRTTLPNALVAVIFIALIAGGLAISLWREVDGRANP